MAETLINANSNASTIALPEEMSATIIQKLQEDSVVMKLAQKIDLPGLGATVPVILGDPEAHWTGETEKKKVKKANYGVKHMGAYTLAVIIPFSNQFRNNMPALYQAIVERLPRALAQKYDKTVFGGATAPGAKFDTLASCTKKDLKNGVYEAFVGADADIAAHDGITNGFVISPAAKALMLTEKDTTGRPLFINSVAEGAIPMVLGVPTLQSKAAAYGTNVGVAGDWTQALYGVNGGVNISISDQATLEMEDGTIINLWQQNMFAVRCEIECGFVADTNCFDLLVKTA